MGYDLLGTSPRRPDGLNKATGKLQYIQDSVEPGCLHAMLHVSTAAHGIIRSVDLGEALQVPGVVAILTGEDCGVKMGGQIQDMPLLARETVRYCGEPVALVVAREYWQAQRAAACIRVIYEPLPVINSPGEALDPYAAPVHPHMAEYKQTVSDLHPAFNTNIVHHAKIRKGNMAEGWAASKVTVEGHFTLPQCAHGYMETRCAAAQIMGDGTVVIETASQAPHAIRIALAESFDLTQGQVEVISFHLGGAYGGKVNGHPEMLAYLASRAVGGKKTALHFTREQCFTSVGCKIGADCTLKIGATREGKIMALEATYHLDTGAYADSGPRMTYAAATSTGELYAIGHIQCDALCIYTNHVYATSFRGFGHEISIFCMERMMDKLAAALKMDGTALRMLNMVKPGDTSTTQVRYTQSNLGSPMDCLNKAMEMIHWDEGTVTQAQGDTVRAKGIACISKTSSSPTDAGSAAVILFCPDGSINVNCGVVECGQGFAATIKQILAEKLKMDPGGIFVKEQIDTRVAPEHWKTVASMSNFLAGNAVLSVTEDAISQLKRKAAIALGCQECHLQVGGGRVYQVSDPDVYMEIKHLTGGLKLKNDTAIGGHIIGRGSYIMEHLTSLDPETGRGRSGPYWTVGAQAVEIEYNKRTCEFRLLKAVTAVDAGKVVHYAISRGQITGGMHMGLSTATREHFTYDDSAKLLDTSFRTYKLLHFAQNPAYEVAFLETPNLDGPYGLRGIGEHGVLGMAPALANALTLAMGKEMDDLPLQFEKLWQKAMQEGAPA